MYYSPVLWSRFFMIRKSKEKIPAPVRIREIRPAMYNRLISNPGGPNIGPCGVNPIVLTELKP